MSIVGVSFMQVGQRYDNFRWVYNHNHRMSGSQLISTFWDQLSSLLPTISSRTSSFILSNHTYISTFYLFINLFIFPNANNWAISCTARDPTSNKQKMWKIMAIWWLGIKCLIWNYNNLEVGYWWVKKKWMKMTKDGKWIHSHFPSKWSLVWY